MASNSESKSRSRSSSIWNCCVSWLRGCGGGSGGSGGISARSHSISTSSLLLWLSSVTRTRSYLNMSIKWLVLLVLCFQNSMFTILRRYSQGVLKERYSMYEVLLAGEVMKMAFSALMIRNWLHENNNMSNNNKSCNTEYSEANSNNNHNNNSYDPNSPPSGSFSSRLWYLVTKSHKMMILALIYGAMNILSFISLGNIGAGMFTIFAQCKILTTATFSTLLLQRHYSATQWRALIGLMFGVLLFSEPIWRTSINNTLLLLSNELPPVTPGITTTTSAVDAEGGGGNPLLGTAAVLTEVTLSGFASIYFEKVIKLDRLKLTIWERNFQLALTSFPVYLAFIFFDSGVPLRQLGQGWSMLTWTVAVLGAAGGILVALSIKYADAILKTLATTGAIVLSSLLDHLLLGGPLTPVMVIAGVQVILAIFNYTFDMTPPTPSVSNYNNNNNTTIDVVSKGSSSVAVEMSRRPARRIAGTGLHGNNEKVLAGDNRGKDEENGLLKHTSVS